MFPVHFPRVSKVFPLEKEADIRRHYTNALKQALFLQSGSSRAGMTLAKENQNRLWQALKTSEQPDSQKRTQNNCFNIFCGVTTTRD